MEEKKWITTEQMLEELKKDANHEHGYSLLLYSGFLTSPHWLVFDSERQMFEHDANVDFGWNTEAEILEVYADCMWCRFA